MFTIVHCSHIFPPRHICLIGVYPLFHVPFSAPEEQGCLAFTSLVLSLWLLLGIMLTTIGSTDYQLYTGMVLTLISIAINLKNNLPLRYRAQYHYRLCGCCKVPWPTYVPPKETDNNDEKEGATELTNMSNPMREKKKENKHQNDNLKMNFQVM